MTQPFDNGTEAVNKLRSSLATLVAESQALRNDVAQAEQARKRATAINISVLGVVAVFTALLLAIGYQNNQLVKRTDETNRRVADCTTAGGRCYEQGRARTHEAIEDVLRVSVYMAECSRLYPNESGPEYDRKLESCVYQRLAEAQRQVPTGPPTGPPAPTRSTS